MTLKTFTMDSNENKCPLMETPAQEGADSIVATNISAAPLQSKEEVIARLEEINQQETTGDKSELDLIKQTFYRLRNAEVELAKKEFEGNGGNPENFVAPKDDFEIKFKEFGIGAKLLYEVPDDCPFKLEHMVYDSIERDKDLEKFRIKKYE